MSLRDMDWLNRQVYRIDRDHAVLRALDNMPEHLNGVVNKTWNSAGRLHTPEDHMLNAVLGLVGEAGEVADIHKKVLYHTKKDRREELKLELGDVAYYWLKLLYLNGFTIQEVLAANREKLTARYPEFFGGQL